MTTRTASPVDATIARLQSVADLLAALDAAALLAGLPPLPEPDYVATHPPGLSTVDWWADDGDPALDAVRAAVDHLEAGDWTTHWYDDKPGGHRWIATRVIDGVTVTLAANVPAVTP